MVGAFLTVPTIQFFLFLYESKCNEGIIKSGVRKIAVNGVSHIILRGCWDLLWKEDSNINIFYSAEINRRLRSDRKHQKSLNLGYK